MTNNPVVVVHKEIHRFVVQLYNDSTDQWERVAAYQDKSEAISNARVRSSLTKGDYRVIDRGGEQ